MGQGSKKPRAGWDGSALARRAGAVRPPPGAQPAPRPAAETWDVVYGVVAGAALPPAHLIVDYDLVRLGAAGARDRRCCELADLEGNYRRVLINALPFTPTAQMKRDFAAAARLLLPAGSLLVVVQFKKAARLVGRLLQEVFAEVDRCRGQQESFLCRQPRADRQPSPGAPEEAGEVVYADPISGRALRFRARSGLFSADEVDPGTRLLLAAAGDLKGLRVLDLGCGYGVIGATAAARGARVTMVDSDARAAALSRRNLEANGLSGEVRLEDGASGLGSATFDRVLSNPPTHAGSAPLQRLFTGAVRVLVPGGRALFVIREHLHYEKWLRQMGTTRTLEAADGYKILELAPA